MDSCVFCDILAGEAPAHIVAENRQAVALLDIAPLSAGHCLVIPRRHVPWWHDLTPEETDGLFRLAREVARRIRDAYHPDFVTLYARGRRIPHTHIFLVPCFGGDPLDRHFNALEGFQEGAGALAALRTPERMREEADKLR